MENKLLCDDENELLKFIKENEDKYNEKIKHVNDNINGRVCMTNYLFSLLAIKEFLGVNCKNYLEIGTLWGGSVCSLMQLDTNYNTNFFCIDIFNGYYGKKCYKNDGNKTNIDVDESNHLEIVRNNINKFNQHQNNFYLIKGKSNETLQEFKKISDNIDLLFIDGDHSEKAVLEDFELYSKLMKKDGILVFDNYGSAG